MPGVSLIASIGNLFERKECISNTLNSLNVFDNYKSTILLFEKDIFLGWNKYEEYPIKIFNIDSFTILLEGKIYNKKEEVLKNELIDIAKNLTSGNIETKLKSWLFTTDGDFIVYFIENKSKHIYLINDIFGRLPLYYSSSGDYIFISRYLKFITEIRGNFEFDKLAIAEFLLIGYLLGERTLYKNVQRLRPASFVKIEKSRLEIKTIHQFNFENREHKDKSLEQNVDELSMLFSNSCRNRFEGNTKNVVTLSGGIDSRLVASCMYKNKIPFNVTTIKYTNDYEKEQIDVSRDLCKIYNVNMNTVTTSDPCGNDVYNLLLAKEGMISLSTANLFSFYNGVRGLYGSNINFITGDNGDKVIFTYDKPIKERNSLKELTEHFIEEYSIFNIDKVCELTGINKNVLYEEFNKILNSFPEKNLTQKYIHLKAVEKPFQSAFQNEDRHRHFFWNSSPFWSFPFFNYIMGIPEDSKKMHILFRKLHQTYSTEAIDLTYSNFKSSITSFKGKIFMAVIFYSYPLVPFSYIKKIKRVLWGGNPSTDPNHVVKKCINVQMENTKGIKEYINLVNNDLILNRQSLYNLFTITSAIELYLNKKSTIIYYSDIEFN